MSTATPTKQAFSDWTWSEQGGTPLQGIPEIDERYGQSVALSNDGQTLVVGAPDALSQAGIVRIYQWKEYYGSWVSIGSLLGRNEGDRFGNTVALSADGRVLAVSEPMYNGSAGDKTGNIRTFVYSPFGYVPREGQDNIEGEDATDHFGVGLALSSDGRRLAVGAPYRDNSHKAAGSISDRISQRISSNSDNNNRLVSGAVKVFEWSIKDKKWIAVGGGGGGGNNESTTTTAPAPAPALIGMSHHDNFGWSVDLNDDGSLLCVGAPRNLEYGGYVQCFEEEKSNENSSSDSNNDDDDLATLQWKQVGDTILNQVHPVRYDDNFGASIKLIRDPATDTRHRVAIGAPGKNGDNADTFDAGLVVVYEFNSGTAERGWIQLGRTALTQENPGKNFQMGYSLDLHGDLLAVGIPGANDSAGKVEVFEFQRDTWQWVRTPSIFEGVDVDDDDDADADADADTNENYGAAISMTPSGDFVVGSPQSGNSIGSVSFYRRERVL